MIVSCLICVSPYLRKTANDLLFTKRLSLDQVAELLNVPPMAVYIHFSEETINRLSSQIDRLEKALDNTQAGNQQILIEEIPASGLVRLNLFDKVVVDININVIRKEEQS